MSADIINNMNEPKVYVVHGVNWHIEVPINQYEDVKLNEEEQAYEAASIAIYIFKGEEGNKLSAMADDERGLFIVMDENEDVPLVASTMIVHMKGTSPTKGFTPFTCEILANCGFYEDSRHMAKILEAELTELKETEAKNLAEEQKLKKLKKRPKSK